MSFWHSDTDESDDSMSRKSPQNVANISGNVQLSDFLGTGNPEKFGTILNCSRAFWNLPVYGSTDTENEEDAIINADGTLSSRNDREMDETTYDRLLSLFHRISVRCRVGEGRPGSSRQTEPVISRKPSSGNLYNFLLLMLVTMVPASAILYGAQYIGHCPGNGLLPYLILSIGVLSTISMVCFSVNVCGEFDYTFGEDLEKIGKMFGFLIGTLMLIEIFLFIYTPISFDTYSEKYCNESLYFYVSFFNVFIITGIFFGALGKWIVSIVLVNPFIDFHEDDLVF